MPLPPLDPELAPFAGDLDGVPPLGLDDVAVLRAGAAAGRVSDDALRARGLDVVTLPGPPELTVYRPAAPGPRPGVLFAVHGGGMVVGDARGRDLPLLLDAAAALGLVVVAPDYRLAPEHPHPAPVRDCFAGLAWAAGHRGELTGDPYAALVVAGVSAGGGLAAALGLLARDRGGPAVDGQLLISPTLDDRAATASARDAASVGRRDRAVHDLMWRTLLGPAAGGPGVPASAAPARADDVTGLAPTYLDVGSAETFRDDVVTWAGRLWAAGNDTELHVWPGAFHGFDVAAPDAALSGRARAQRVAWLRRLLS